MESASKCGLSSVSKSSKTSLKNRFYVLLKIMECVSECGLSSVSKSSKTSIKTRFYVPLNNGVCPRMWPQLGEQNQFKNSILRSFEKCSSVFEFEVPLNTGVCLRTWPQFSEQIQQNQLKILDFTFL
jgi:hypothetical protein